MKTTIKTKNAKPYQLVFDKNPARPPLNVSQSSPALSSSQVGAILIGAKPNSHKDRSSLWKAVKPIDGKVLVKESKIFEKIISLEAANRIQLQALEAITPPAVMGGVSSGRNSGGSRSSGRSAEPANLGPARLERDVSAETPPPAAETPHTEGLATTTAEAPTNGGQKIEDTPTDGDPVSMVTGEEMLQYTDFALPGPVPFAWKRIYRSSQTRDIGLGIAWSHSGSEHLEMDHETVMYVDDEGRSIPFNIPSVNQRSKYLPEGLNLDRMSENSFILKQEGQWDKVFSRSSHVQGHFRLTELHHMSYRPAQNVLGVLSSESGFCIKLHYNDQNRISRILGSWGKSLRLERNQQGRIQAVFLSNDKLQQEKILAQYEYNSSGDLISHRNAKDVGEQYEYKNHLLTQRTLKTGFRFCFEWDGDDHTARCIHNWGDRGIYEYYFDWDTKNKRSKATDSRGFQCEYHYNEYGQVIERKDNEGAVHQTRYANGRKISTTDPEGHTTEYFYDSENNAVGIRDALGNRVAISYFQGKPISVVDKDKTKWQREYNRKGQLTSLVNPYNQNTRYRYNDQGLVSAVIDPLNRKTFYRWNDQGELIKVTDSMGHTRQFRYDPWGQVIAMEFLVDGKDIASRTEYAYSATGFIEKIKAPNSETSYTYNENDQLTRHSDPQGRTTEFLYDGLSQVVERFDAEGQHLKYEYDTERNLTALINENGERYQFFYDGNERLIKEIGFDGRVQHYQYNGAGYLIKHMDAGEVLTEFERDALGQMVTKTSKSIKSQEQQEERTRFQYDAKGRIKETYNANQLLVLDYNRFGNIEKEQHCDINSRNKLVSSSRADIGFTYNWPGIRSAIQLPDGQDIRYSFDVNSQLSGVDLFEGGQHKQLIANIQRDKLGREITRHQGQITTETHYDPMGRLQKQLSYKKESESLGPIQREYNYDKFGNLSQLTDGDQNTKFIYDFVNRLERVYGGQSEQFAFDPASNLVSIDGNPVSKSEGNRLAMQGDRKFTYDARGNLVKENRGKDGNFETFYHYNLQNQLIKVEKDHKITEYRYDPLGRRIEKKDKSGNTQYLWVGDQLTQETRNNIKKTYIYEPESFKPLAMVQDGEIYHYHLDHLGTPKELSDQQGKIVWKAQYKAYGDIAVKEIEEVENNLRFQGQYFDEETGLHYNRHRYYNPSTGQFVTQDPAGLLGGVNGYQYAPNPMLWVDPLGLKAKDCELAKLVDDDPARAFFKIKGMIQSGDLDFSTGKDEAVFWGASRHDNTNNMEIAQEWAKYNNKTTLEQTIGGQVLDKLELFSKDNFDPVMAAKLWNMVSTKFALGANGDISVFNSGANRMGDWGERTWWRIEKPILVENKQVDSATKRKMEVLLRRGI